MLNIIYKVFVFFNNTEEHEETKGVCKIIILREIENGPENYILFEEIF